MKTAAFIPIKQLSERVKGKNFRLISGIPLYKSIITKALKSESFTTVFVDTDSDEIANFAISEGAEHIQRREDLAKNTANGNDLLVHHMQIHPDYDYYFQLFATAPFMKISTIQAAVNGLLNSAEHDSVLTVIPHHGFFWRAGMPISYRPDLLPRSQDLTAIEEETTGLYGIFKDSLKRLNARIGAKPLFIPVNKLEAVDLNTEEDFAFAEWLVEKGITSMMK